MKLLNAVLTDLKNVIFPDYCPGCRSELLSAKQLLCTECLIQIPFTDHFETEDNKAASHFYGRIHVKACASVVYFRRSGLMQNILHTLKYENNPEAAIAFGQIAGEKMLTSPYFRDVSALIPVPLHYKKERLRGYNQSAMFAKGIHQVYGLPVWNDILLKPKENVSQTGKARTERIENVTGVYSLSRHQSRIYNKNIVLIDDVITTGSTLEACFQTLLEAKPKSISIVTLACAL